MGAQDLDRWPGLSTEPPRQPDKQPGVDILLLNRRERERTLKGCLATGLQPLRQENQGGGGERYSPRPHNTTSKQRIWYLKLIWGLPGCPEPLLHNLQTTLCPYPI